MKQTEKKHDSDERDPLVNGSARSYSKENQNQSQSSRLEWAESSWTRWLHVLFWWWVNPTLSLAYKQSLTERDLDGLYHEDKSSVLLNKLHLCDWTTTTTRKILIQIFGKEFIFVSLFFLPYIAARIAQPLLLREIVLHIQDKRGSLSITYLYAILLFLSMITQSVLQPQTFFRPVRIGLRIRNALISVIYRQLLSTEIVSLQQISTAQVINLVVQDSTKFLEACKNLHYIWAAPLEAITVFVILCYIIGPLPTFLGYVVFLLFIPIQLCFSRKFSQYRVKTTSCTEKRIHIFNEFIYGYSVIKMYNWEKMIRNSIKQIRENEFSCIWRASRLHAFNLTLYCVSTGLLGFVTFSSAWLLGDQLNTANIFTTLAFFIMMRQTVGACLLQAIEDVSEIQLASERIDMFMKLAMKQKQRSLPLVLSNALQLKGRLVMHNASFSWDGDNPCLSSLNITIEPGTFVGIVGSVGSGKSSLFAAILGEVNLLSGQSNTYDSSFSYAAQSPWIFADTLRNNILLGRPFDQERYRNVLHACCLDVDLSVFGSKGDLIVIGEKGANLSGGQKARVSLARALYADADIYLFDDPLAAVDPTVAKNIYERCLGPRGLLKEKTRLLITHQTRFLTESNQIIFLVHGKIDEEGHFDQDIIQEDNEMPTEKSKLASILDVNSYTTDNQSIIDDETPVTGTISWSLFCRLFTASPLGGFGLCLLIVLLVISEGCYDGSNYWLSRLSRKFDANQRNLNMDIYIYFGLILSTLLIFPLAINYFFFVLLHGSNRLHNNMLNGLLGTSVRFFESNPTGRILNRVSGDQQVIDELIPVTMFITIQSLLEIIGAVTIITIINPYILILFVPLLMVLYMLTKFYLQSIRQMKRLENVSRSPIYALFSSSLSGLPTIRAFEMKDDFVQLLTERIDTNTRAYIPMYASMQWFGFRVNLLCSLVTLVTTIFLIALHNQINPSASALSIMYTISLSGLLQWSLRQAIETEILLARVEHIDEYAQLPPEEDQGGEKRILKTPPDWPNRGTIQFRNYSLRYRSSLDPILKNINVRIESGEKIGVIGRTGAGKSSLLNGLFRFADRSCVTGEILIDDVDISRLRLNHLRSHLSVIPQHPILFSGTLRYNLDPFGYYSDEQCLMALEDVQLKYLVSNQPEGLSLLIAESGSNLSAGECQLICVARAILRKSKIILIDEATANVDLRTDEILQSVMTNKFQDRTVITIAHRLNTIANKDRILVLDKGMVVNFDTPTNVLHHFQ